MPIVDPLLTNLTDWQKLSSGVGLVFPNRDGRTRPSARLFQEVLHRVLGRAEFPETQQPNGKIRRYITFHGLRHTFASHWAMSGGSMFRLQRILGHSSMDLTLRYAHLQPDCFRGDYGRFGGDLADGRGHRS